MKQSTLQRVDQSAKRQPLPQQWPPGVSGNHLGRRSPIERARQLAEARKVVVAELTAELATRLGRQPGRAELLLIESAAAQAQEGAELRRRGRSSAEPDRLLARMLGMLGLAARSAAEPRNHASFDELSTAIGAEAARHRVAELDGEEGER